jgi:hypothetical protein
MESIIVRAIVLFALALVTGLSDGQTPVNEPIKSIHISGRVTDITGAPIAHAAVKIKVLGLGQSTAIAETDENGSFEFAAVVPQQFELFIEGPGFRLLTVPLKATNRSPGIDVGTLVLEVAPLWEPVNIPYDPSTLPNWLKSDPGATFLPNPPADREENTASRWQTASCSKLNRSARHIVSMNRIVEFHIPPSAHLTETADADHVDYHVRYGPSREKAWLKFTVGPMVGGYSPHDAQSGAIRWTWRKWTCNGIEGNDVRGLSSDGNKWRYINIPASGFAAYESVDAKAADYFDGILDTMCCARPTF